jgi:ubiquinone/menaquinone biosynthesis C-methylase UbiE
MTKTNPEFDLQKLKNYYEKRAKEGPAMIKSTFKSPNLYKKIFYSTRVDKIIKLLDIKSKDKILEIGCGEGYYTKQIGAISPNLIATDISQNYLIKAKSYNPYSIMDYICCPAEKLPFDNNSFDKILMSEVIEHLTDWQKGIEEAKRILKPGGKLIITTPNKYSYLNFLTHSKTLIKNSSTRVEHIKEFSRKELKAILKKYFFVEKFFCVNYFPVLLPKSLEKTLGFRKIKNIVENIERIFEKIPVIRGTRLIIIACVVKPDE